MRSFMFVLQSSEMHEPLRQTSHHKIYFSFRKQNLHATKMCAEIQFPKTLTFNRMFLLIIRFKVIKTRAVVCLTNYSNQYIFVFL